ncbi:hypothetical protein OS493_039652 [Desmophyllum pertusum]|uniref:Uncharacterized protein n=1 Tax=Desmophyllum pertusum TaxID=174260 RepID=A0A9W9ZHK9_9CNID|nr:hypothetical protein OS493_039652 [Desmophyllum pertusum]
MKGLTWRIVKHAKLVPYKEWLKHAVNWTVINETHYETSRGKGSERKYDSGSSHVVTGKEVSGYCRQIGTQHEKPSFLRLLLSNVPGHIMWHLCLPGHDSSNSCPQKSGVDLSPLGPSKFLMDSGSLKSLRKSWTVLRGTMKQWSPVYARKKTRDIQKATEKIKLSVLFYLRWAPVVDKNFLHDTPGIYERKEI